MSEKQTTGQRIAAARIHVGMTQQDLADSYGCLQGQVSAWERGDREPKLSTLRVLASAIGCPVSDLVQL